MWSSNPTSSCLLLLFLLTSIHGLFAYSTRKPYIVYLGSHSHGAGNAMTEVHKRRVEDSHVEFLRSYLGSYEKAKESIFASYKREINGFAAYLDEHEADEIAKNPQVVSVFLNQEKELQTMHSWEFMLVENDGVVLPSSIWKKTRYGESAIIGSIDSGIWPESKSFNDEGYGPVPTWWNGTCQNENDPEFRCNRKLIGAKYFCGNSTLVEGAVMSPRDYLGHGTATLSVAGGNFVPGVSLFGMDNQTTLKGGAPRARLSVYKACWTMKCRDSDLLKAFDAAISDEVSVISIAIGQKEPTDYVLDSISIGSFHAAKKGILVVGPAGNYGPKLGTVINSSPWILTVAASTTDRQFQNMVELPNGVILKGASLSGKSHSKHVFYPLITGADARASYALPNDAKSCQPTTLDPKKVKGKILICLRYGANATMSSEEALAAGAAGLIIFNDVSLGDEITADPHVLPASHISYRESLALFEYMNSTKDPFGHITPTSIIYNSKPAPFMAASYSSVGPNRITPEILKPDITAPGVNIVSASGSNKAKYAINTGTSMAGPHVAGIAAIIKAEHPDWTAAAVKSAIMTTARTRANTARAIVDASGKRATPFHYGSGHLRPNQALDPGLVYDANPEHYSNFLCALGYRNDDLGKFWNESLEYRCPDSTNVIDLNYPSIMVPELNDKISFNRTVTNVGPPPVTYNVHIRQPPHVTVTINPSTLDFVRIGEPKNFTITIEVSRQVSGSGPKTYVFGGLKWSDGKHHVRSPIVVGLGSQ